MKYLGPSENLLLFDVKINIVQFIDVETANRFLMFAEPGVEFLWAFEFVFDIKGHVSFAWRFGFCV